MIYVPPLFFFPLKRTSVDQFQEWRIRIKNESQSLIYMFFLIIEKLWVKMMSHTN